ncbi:MAG: nitroreductase family protein [Dehalococcoidales bacterium]|nr:nitroreductase family protein [Dehalococcoidales bacterium]
MTDIDGYDAFLSLVKKRRTVRQFLPDPVPDEYIIKIIDAARWAPSGFHTQPWEFVVINDEEVKNKIVGVLDNKGQAVKNPEKEHLERRSFRDAPVFIFQLCDWRAKVGLPFDTGGSNERIAGLYNSSMANAFLLMHLAAASLGLASQWYTSTTRPEVEKAVREIIGIPEALTIYDMMVVGYAAVPPNQKIIREPSEMIHYNACGTQDFRTDAEVTAYAAVTKQWCMSEH